MVRPSIVDGARPPAQSARCRLSGADRGRFRPPAKAREVALNYRHAFHAGNFADVLKHAVWLHALTHATTDPTPLEVIDTHAGAGLYDLSQTPTRPGRAGSGEAEGGIRRLMADPDPPAAMLPLAQAVRALNGGAAGPLYPGSPLLTAQALRPGDRLVACELRPDDQADLAELFRTRRGPAAREARLADGYATVQAARPHQRRLVLIDPPFERGDEAASLAEALRPVLRRGEAAVVWAPLKDLDGFDRLLGRIEALDAPPSLAAQVRLRPLDDPMRLNGCALLLLGLPMLESVAGEIAAYVAARSGSQGAVGRVDRFGG